MTQTTDDLHGRIPPSSSGRASSVLLHRATTDDEAPKDLAEEIQSSPSISEGITTSQARFLSLLPLPLYLSLASECPVAKDIDFHLTVDRSNFEIAG